MIRVWYDTSQALSQLIFGHSNGKTLGQMVCSLKIHLQYREVEVEQLETTLSVREMHLL